MGPATYVARLTRSGVLDALDEEYIRTARAKGLSERRVLLKHALTNALGPLITVSGPLLATLVTGSFIVEQVFAIPGMGRYFITAVIDRDYPTVMGVTLVYAALIVLANIVVDVLYAVADPRVEE
jgi:oligopeptide transport system permease protein